RPRGEPPVGARDAQRARPVGRHFQYTSKQQGLPVRGTVRVGASIVGVNCSDGPMAVLAAVEKMIPVGIPVLAAPNAGLPRRVDERMVYVSTPEYFGVYARRMVRVGVRLVGGCCGTTPDHVRRIAAAARM